MFKITRATVENIETLSKVPAKASSRAAILECLDNEIRADIQISALTFSGPNWPFEELLCSRRKVKRVVSLEHDPDIYKVGRKHLRTMQRRHPKTKWDILPTKDSEYIFANNLPKENFNLIWLDYMGHISGCHWSVMEYIAMNAPAIFKGAWDLEHPGFLAVTIATTARNKEIELPFWEAFNKSRLIPPVQYNPAQRALFRLQGLSLSLNQWGSKTNFVPVNYYTYRGHHVTMALACWSVVNGKKINPDKLVLNSIHELYS